MDEQGISLKEVMNAMDTIKEYCSSFHNCNEECIFYQSSIDCVLEETPEDWEIF